MRNLNYYFNEMKTGNSPEEADFVMLLSKINTRTEVRNDFYTNRNSYVEKIKSPVFAWSFGFAGFAMAAFMFFVNTANNTPDLAINVSSNNPVVNKTKQTSSNAINIIDEMNSFGPDLNKKEI